MKVKALFSSLAIVGLLTVIPVAARADGIKVKTDDGIKLTILAWQEKAYVEGAEASPAGGRLGVDGSFNVLGREFDGNARLDLTSLNGEAVDFGNISTLGNHAAFRLSVTSAVGGNLSVGAFGGFATALDKNPEPLRRFPREYGAFVRFTDKASASTFDVGYCRSEATRTTFGVGQVCFSGEVPIGFVRFGGDVYLDLKNDTEGKDLVRLKVGVSVPDLIKDIKGRF